MSRALQVLGLATASVGLGVAQLWAGLLFGGLSMTVLGVSLELEAKRVSKLP